MWPAWGRGNYTFAEATPAQTLPHWIGSHERALAFFGGVPKAIVPDNLKSGVTDPCRYEPGVNPSYHAFAETIRWPFLPARAKKPRDKSPRWEKSGTGSGTSDYCSPLRHQRFTSFADLNAAIRERLERPQSSGDEKLWLPPRRTLFEQVDPTGALPAPAHPALCLCPLETSQS